MLTRFLLVLLISSTAALAVDHNAFTIPAPPAEGRQNAPAVKAEEKIFVRINPDSLKKDQPIAVNLPQNIVATYKKKSFKQRGEGDYTWVGEPTDGPIYDSAILTTKSGATFGIIKHKGKRYILQKEDGDVYSIRFQEEPKREGIDYKVPPEPKTIELVPQGARESEPLIIPSAPEQTAALPSAPTSALDANTTYVDVLVLYTQAYADFHGASLDAVIQSTIDYANNALENTQTGMQYRLDHQVLYENSGSNEDANISAALNYITDDDAVKLLRAEQGSDLVTLFRLNLVGGTVGLGWIAQSTSRAMMRRYSFNVSEYYELTFAHEAGHNLGCGHDHTTGCNSPLYDYSCGHLNSAFGTIMSYASSYGKPYIEYFSNPDLTYGGLPVGVAEGNPNPADCGRTIEITKSVMAMNDTVEEPNEPGDTVSGNYSITGLLTDGGDDPFLDDRDSFTLNLGGETTFTASSQFGDPYYFMNLYKDGNYLIGSFNDASKTMTLESGEYILVISKMDDDTTVYYTDTSTREYTITIATDFTAPPPETGVNPALLFYLLN